MKLYSFHPSPFGSRVRLAMYHKGIAFEIAAPPSVNPESAPFLAESPMEVPTLLARDGFAVCGSAAILEYLEDAYPEPSLRPAGIEELALARMLLQVPDTYMQNAPRRLFAMANPAERREDIVDEQVGLIATALQFVDKRLNGSAWAVGDRVSIADCALIPILNAIDLLGRIHGRPDMITRYDNLGRYWDSAQRDPVNARLIAEQVAGLPSGLQAFVRSAVDALAETTERAA